MMAALRAAPSEATLQPMEDGNRPAESRSRSPAAGSMAETASTRRSSIDREFSRRDYVMVRWDPDEPANPYNWPIGRKAYIVFAGMLQVINSTLGSAAPAGATSEIGEYFHITSSQQLTLPISSYLIGYVVGPLAFGPLSETYGRRQVMIYSFGAFALFTLASALAPNFTALCFFRLFTGTFASSPIVVIGGLYADIFDHPVTRGRAMAVFMACTTWGPTASPVISGFVATVSWRWAFWVGLIFAGVCFPVILCLPETYGPVLLRDKARRLRKEDPETKYLAKIELESTKLRDIVTRVIFRPVSMVLHESIVSFTCLYLSLIYAIFYLFFEAYPIIFQDMYHLSPGVAGLAFLPIAIGSIFAFCMFLGWDKYLRVSKARQKPWALQEEFQRLPLSFIGGPALSVGVFWLAWASWPQVHPIVPMLGGIPFGIGFLLIFMALINYLTDAYDIYAASALAAASFTRSIFGAVLPLAAEPMYNALGIHWATSLLGFASAIMVLVPLAFIRFGPYLRAHSRFCLELEELREHEAREDRRAARDRHRRSLGADQAELEKHIEHHGAAVDGRQESQGSHTDVEDDEAPSRLLGKQGEKALEAGPSRSPEIPCDKGTPSEVPQSAREGAQAPIEVAEAAAI